MTLELGDTVEGRTIFMAIIQGTVVGIDGETVFVLTNRGNVHRCRVGRWLVKVSKP